MEGKVLQMANIYKQISSPVVVRATAGRVTMPRAVAVEVLQIEPMQWGCRKG